MVPDRRFALLLACFFGSGFAALVYETAWTRQFAFVFGTSDFPEGGRQRTRLIETAARLDMTDPHVLFALAKLRSQAPPPVTARGPSLPGSARRP